MDLGGYVATGGPYQIAHQAPAWIWLMPLLIFGGMFFWVINDINANKIGCMNLIFVVWSLLFLLLGHNFLEYGFSS